MRSRSRFATDIKLVGDRLEGPYKGKDVSLELITYLALAHKSALRLSEQGVDLDLQGSPLVLSPLRRAYREAIHLRSRLDESYPMDTEFITRFGRWIGG